MTQESKSFEAQMQELDELVKSMENGKMSLEETLRAYREGMKMADELGQRLSQAEKTMLEYTQDGLKPMEDAP